MSEKPYKLGQWFWGRLPELPEQAVVAYSTESHDATPSLVYGVAKRENASPHYECWWCIVSDTPPLPPEPELRLPEGYRLLCDEPTACGHLLRISKGIQMPFAIIHVVRSERAECVHVVQAAVDAMEGVK